jgi:uncharacterized membrane protein YcaP (DUF421 family)
MDYSTLLFDGWPSIARTAFVGGLSYVVLVTVLRTAGKRTLAKMNAYSLVVTVALGSTLASALTARDVVLSDALIAFLLLAGLQYVISWMSVRSEWAERAVRSKPALLVRRGEMLRETMRGGRVSEAEVLAAARAHGIGSLSGIDAVVLENDGSFSVLREAAVGSEGTLRDVAGYSRID